MKSILIPSVAFIAAAVVLFPVRAFAHGGLAEALIAFSLGVHFVYSLILAGVMTVVFRRRVASKWLMFLLTFIGTFFLDFVVIFFLLTASFLGDGLTVLAYFAVTPFVAMGLAKLFVLIRSSNLPKPNIQ